MSILIPHKKNPDSYEHLCFIKKNPNQHTFNFNFQFFSLHPLTKWETVNSRLYEEAMCPGVQIVKQQSSL